VSDSCPLTTNARSAKCSNRNICDHRIYIPCGKTINRRFVWRAEASAGTNSGRQARAMFLIARVFLSQVPESHNFEVSVPSRMFLLLVLSKGNPCGLSLSSMEPRFRCVQATHGSFLPARFRGLPVVSVITVATELLFVAQETV